MMSNMIKYLENPALAKMIAEKLLEENTIQAFGHNSIIYSKNNKYYRISWGKTKESLSSWESCDIKDAECFFISFWVDNPIYNTTFGFLLDLTYKDIQKFKDLISLYTGQHINSATEDFYKTLLEDNTPTDTCVRITKCND